MVKAALKSIAVQCLERLPPSVQRSAIERFAARVDAYDIFQSLGRAYGVKDLRIAGRYGLIEGSIEDGSILANYGRTKSWAASTTGLLIDFFRTHGRGTYLDIGANIGLTTIPVADRGDVACLAFEPEPTNYRYLDGNIRRNCRHGNVELFDVALFDRPATVDFELSKQNLGDHRIHVDGHDGAFSESTREIIRVRAEKLDALIGSRKLITPLAAKIDTQGTECQVFAGGAQTLGRADFIAFEYWPYGIRRANGDVGFLASFVAEHFSQGAIANGDSREVPPWQPIAAVAKHIEAFGTATSDAPYPYNDIFVRK